MGQSAEKMAKINHIPREEQDQFALRSHRLAAAGTQDGRLTAEIMPVYVPPQYEEAALERQRHSHRHEPGAARGAQAGVRPALRHGDGGELVAAHRRRGAVLLMSEERAKALGYTPLAYIRSRTRTPRSIPASSCCRRPCSPRRWRSQRAGLALGDMDLVEMHEAFAAQVLCNLRGFESQDWAERAGFTQPRGRGGSLAAQRDGRVDRDRASVRRHRRAHHDHARERAARRGGQFGLMTVCAAGGIGFAMVVENAS